MSARINSRNWPIWVLVVATAWFVVIAVVWATKPLTDRVPTTAAHVYVANDPAPPGARDNAGVVEVTCGEPAGSDALGSKGLPTLKVLQDQRFSRVPCESFHEQSRYLFVADTVLYIVTVVGVGLILVRRRRPHRAARAALA